MPSPIFTRRLLEFDRPKFWPWFTVELVEQEMKIQEYAEDAIAIFTDSLEDMPE